MNEGDSLLAINVLIAEHCMLCYPMRSRSLSRRAVARTGKQVRRLNRASVIAKPGKTVILGACSGNSI
jgi:hypothetical protein